MATTVTAPVNNSIALAQRYLPMLDEIYTTESKTAILDTLAERVEFTGANTVNLYTLSTVGMGNYDRNAGFVPGDVTGQWTPYVLETDRGRSYMIDTLDNEESMGMAFGGLMGTVERQHVIPEVDAFRFAAYSAGANASNVVSATISTGAAAVAAIDAATVALDEAEVPYEGRILFVNPTFYGMIKSGITRFVENRDRNIDYNVDIYNDMRVITVPTKRFNTQITLAAPNASNGAGGYTATGSDINFMIVHPSAVMQVMKHYVPRIFSPEVNQEADAWKLNLRYAHGAWVLSNKDTGIYVHTK
jgi:hypothetical protein